MYQLLSFRTDIQKRRLIGLLLCICLISLFFAINRLPKIDTINSDLAIVSSPTADCFQGFCIENVEKQSFFKRWWHFSVEYLKNVSVGMAFAFLMAGITESFIFPRDINRRFTGNGISGILKGVIVGPVVNLCSACIVPIANGFRRSGASVEATVAITQSSPTLNLLALAMAIIVFSPMIGASRVILSLIGAFILGPIVALIVRDGRVNDGLEEEPAHFGKTIEISEFVSWRESLVTASLQCVRSTINYVLKLGPIMVVAGFGSGLVIQWISPQTVTTWIGDDVLGILVATTIGILINVPLMFEIPLVAAMLLAGMGTAPAVSLLFTAAASGPITFWGLTKAIPKRGVFTLFVSTWVLGTAGGLIVLFVTSLTEENREFTFRANYESTQLLSEARFYQGDLGHFSEVSRTNLNKGSNLMNYHPGVTVFDYDRDGDLDLYITAETGWPNFLYQNDGNGFFVDVADLAGVSAIDTNATGAVACDLDNDGYQDLYVGGRGLAFQGGVTEKGDGIDFKSSLNMTQEDVYDKSVMMDRIYRNNRDGTFTDITDSALEGEFNYRSASSVACADVDNDGWSDIFVGNFIDMDFNGFNKSSHPGHFNLMYRNLQGMKFEEIGLDSGLRGGQVSMLDPLGEPVIFIDPTTGMEYEGYDPQDMDREGNPIGDPTGRTLAAVFFDHDRDGDSDLWIGNDGDSLHVYRNDSSAKKVIFTDISHQMGLGKLGNWMGFAVGDYDNDMDLDVFITNHGFNILAFPPKDLVSGDCRYFHQFEWGTCLHFLLKNMTDDQSSTNGGLPVFQDVASSTYVEPSPIMPPTSLSENSVNSSWPSPQGLAAYEFGYGVTFFDFNNDGNQDIYWLGSEINRGDGPGGEIIQSAGRLLLGDGMGSFRDVTVQARALDILGVDYSVLDPSSPSFDRERQRINAKFHENGKGLAHGDFNNDGYVDLVGTNSSGPMWVEEGNAAIPKPGNIFLWLNSGGKNNWLTLRLKGRMAIDGTGSNSDGIGAKVYLKRHKENGDYSEQLMEVIAGSSYLSMHSMDLEYGLNQSDIVEEIKIIWPSGIEQILEDVGVNQVLFVEEPITK